MLTFDEAAARLKAFGHAGYNIKWRRAHFFRNVQPRTYSVDKLTGILWGVAMAAWCLWWGLRWMA